VDFRTFQNLQHDIAAAEVPSNLSPHFSYYASSPAVCDASLWRQVEILVNWIAALFRDEEVSVCSIDFAQRL
jgi:hypothetical protein